MENWAMKISPTLARAPRAELKRMLCVVDWTRFDLDVDAVRTLCESGARFNSGDKSCRVEELWTLWQSYLAGDVTLEDVYRSHLYLSDAWSSWAVHSRKNLREAFGPRFVDGGLLNAVSDPRAIVDLGNGLGITTRVMAEAYPEALVVGTNIPGSIQEAIASTYSGGMFAQFSDTYEAKEFLNASGIERAGLVVGLEYFEHFEIPLAHLAEVLMLLDPAAIAIGHAWVPASPLAADLVEVIGVH